MALFRRNRPHEQIAGLQAEVARLHEVTNQLALRVNRLESRPLPRPNPVTPDALDRVELVANEAARAASIARADVAVRMSTIDGMVAELEHRLADDREALCARIDDLSKALEHQAAYLEAHADRLVARTRDGVDRGDESGLHANQTRIAGDLARLSIELREEVARLTGVVEPGDVVLTNAGSPSTNGHTIEDGAAAETAAGVVDLRS